MKKSDFKYDLPQELIAQAPLKKRDDSRLLVYERASGKLTHTVFSDIGRFLKNDDILVANNSKVMPAKLFGKSGDGKKVEILLCKRLQDDVYIALLKPAKKVKIGELFKVCDSLMFAAVAKGEYGEAILKLFYYGSLEKILQSVGAMPLPHYIKQELDDGERYQTVYAKESGSAAAPTAGLHFTPDLIKDLKSRGIEWQEVCLHVGIGTFRPLKCENVEEHKMHTESFWLSESAAYAINKGKDEGRRIIAVGTTATRVLESCYEDGKLIPKAGETNIFIYPPYDFKVIDGLITNFHLPESTLIMLISAFLGKDKALEIYAEAVRERYRFFSFGDACLFI